LLSFCSASLLVLQVQALVLHQGLGLQPGLVLALVPQLGQQDRQALMLQLEDRPMVRPLWAEAHTKAGRNTAFVVRKWLVLPERIQLRVLHRRTLLEVLRK
jgi:hypothetical protein